LRRRDILASLGGAAIGWPLAARAQGSGKVHRIGVLWPVSDDAVLEAFRQGLRDLGHVEG